MIDMDLSRSIADRIVQKYQGVSFHWLQRSREIMAVCADAHAVHSYRTHPTHVAMIACLAELRVAHKCSEFELLTPLVRFRVTRSYTYKNRTYRVGEDVQATLKEFTSHIEQGVDVND